MPDGQIFSFGPYQLDIRKEQLWCATQPVRLTPKAFQLLSYVVARPGQLVTKEELFQVVWAETVVSAAALTTSRHPATPPTCCEIVTWSC